jgi:hypothetical protein
MIMRLIGMLADQLVAAVVPRTTAGACACNGCTYEKNAKCVVTNCALVCRDCWCNEENYSCVNGKFCL